MAISGEKREQKEFNSKKVGLFEASAVAVNPSTEDYLELTGFELKEDSKKTEYLGESKDGNAYLRVDIWLKAVGNDFQHPISFFLENKERENKDFTKKQWINSIGMCCWADSESNLPDWFTGKSFKREYRVAFNGEEELHNFLRVWLELDYSQEDTTMLLDFKRLIKGNVKEIREQIGAAITRNVVALATVNVKEKDGEVKEYQSIYNKSVLPPYSLKNFRLVDYSSPEVIERLKAKKPRDLKAHEKFVVEVTSEYGCKDVMILKELREYNSEDFLVASDKVINSEDSSY